MTPLLLLTGCGFIGFVLAVSRLGPVAPLAIVATGLAVRSLFHEGSDAVTYLTLVLVAQFALPARLVVGPLKSAGSPAMLLALGAFVLWAGSRIAPAMRANHGAQPLRAIVIAFVTVNVASYAMAGLRPMNGFETRSADRGMLLNAAMIGVVLLACDGVVSRARLETLVRRLVVAGAALSLLGVVSFIGGPDVGGSLSVPGLTVLTEGFEETRSSFQRVAGTTAHAIEFSVVLTMILPFAIHVASYASSHRRWWWALTGLIAVGVPMSVARSGTVGVAIVALMLLPSWPKPRRRQAYAIAVGYLVVMRLVFPGLLGTLKSLFLSVGVDPSVTGRTVDYAYTGTFFAERPFLGRGFGTFLPTGYQYLDNQYLGTLVETGIIGLGALLALFISGLVISRSARRAAADERTKDLAQSFAASIAVAAGTSATFDFLGFSTARFVLLLVLGLAASLWHMGRPVDPRHGPAMTVPAAG